MKQELEPKGDGYGAYVGIAFVVAVVMFIVIGLVEWAVKGM